MSEIKFRALNPIENGLEYWTLNDLCYHCPDRPDICLQNWQQFTGLTDKNGKEIYEGDIMSFKRKTKEMIEVKWREDGFKCGLKISENCTTWYGLEHFIDKYNCEVIGNIFENPELFNL